ncbi:DUF433 domain-containing protein [Plectonema cf. radiosum LEGE 06105]|uniref:DUF433 domain-containing protein n=1 Tax=Plectonema cf. radiosum LEGE 06105 TaxID=945769 RepID=A0A8J7F9R0_9CYAN|nr:DUF433 domain-containing protein [Plectonema radiosum]MBE9214249.1 DUF433 domain-containing protein [Plectonema cf. radiosum LEGE 06105]
MTQATNTGYKYIEVDENNVPFIIGTRMKVVEIITSVYAYGWNAEELHFQYPYLTMSQIHSALAYYWDNQEDINADMQRRLENVENLRQSHGESAIAKRLRTQGQ